MTPIHDTQSVLITTEAYLCDGLKNEIGIWQFSHHNSDFFLTIESLYRSIGIFVNRIELASQNLS